MAAFVKLTKDRANGRAQDLKSNVDAHSRFHQFCTSSTVFPPPPPVSALSATERLKKFKAVCIKKQTKATVPSKVSTLEVSSKKSLPKKFTATKKGIRKSLLLTAGKSPGLITPGKKKLIKRKSIFIQRNLVATNSKMIEVGNASSKPVPKLDEEVDSSGGSENICDLKKKALKKVFSSDDKHVEHLSSNLPEQKSDDGQAVHPQNGNSDSEIDIMNDDSCEVSNTNGYTVNGNHEGKKQNTSKINGEAHDHVSLQNGNMEAEHKRNENNLAGNVEYKKHSDPEFKETNGDCPESKSLVNEENDTVEFIYKNSSQYSKEEESKTGGKPESKLQKQENENDSEIDEEEFSFDAVLQPTESEAEVDNPEIQVKMTEESCSEIQIDSTSTDKELREKENESTVERSHHVYEDCSTVPSVVAAETSVNDSCIIENNPLLLKSNKNECEKSILIVDELKSRSTKTKSNKTKSSSPAKKAISKRQPSLKTKSSPVRKSPRSIRDTLKPKPESSATLSKFTIPSSDKSDFNETIDLVSPEASCSSKNIASVSEVMGKPSEVKDGEPFEGLAEKHERIEKRLEESPTRVREPFQRGYSPSRRAPLRTSGKIDRSFFDSTPQNKRKADSWWAENMDVKRVKNDGPRWSFFSSPIKCYWSPKLANNLMDSQTNSSKIDDSSFLDFDEQESSPEKGKENTSSTSQGSSNRWCVVM